MAIKKKTKKILISKKKVTKQKSGSKRLIKLLPPVVPPKKAVHYTEKYLIDPPHPVTINVIGCGGTGSQVLTSLARMSCALKALGHPGLYVRAIDPDRVTEANLGRQLFSPADVDEFKASVLIGRINRFFGFDWSAVPEYYNEKTTAPFANITISCVDSGASRLAIKNHLKTAQERRSYYHEPFEKAFYWMDYGNMMDRGQVVIGTIRSIDQPKQSEFDLKATLPTVDMLHPDILKDKKGDDQGPSCSLAEALGKQDLFINTNLANMGLCFLWKMFRDLKLEEHGCYLNLKNMSVNPIKIK